MRIQRFGNQLLNSDSSLRLEERLQNGERQVIAIRQYPGPSGNAANACNV